jgi:hypothetical protein
MNCRTWVQADKTEKTGIWHFEFVLHCYQHAVWQDETCARDPGKPEVMPLARYGERVRLDTRGKEDI